MKACPVLVRRSGAAREILIFRHPTVGLQLVKGTVEPGETSEAAALRELEEEAGISAAAPVRPLGISEDVLPGEVWRFHLLRRSGLPEQWRHTARGDRGGTYHFFWHNLERRTDPGFDPRYLRAMDFISTHLREGDYT